MYPPSRPYLATRHFSGEGVGVFISEAPCGRNFIPLPPFHPKSSEGTITRVSCNPTFCAEKKGPIWGFSAYFPVFKAEKDPQKICAKPWSPVIRA